MTKQELMEEIREDNTLVLLQEVGYIDIDDIQSNLNDFILALEEVTGKEYVIKEKIGKRVIEEV